MPWHMVIAHQECQYLLANEQPKASQSGRQAHDGMLTQSNINVGDNEPTNHHLANNNQNTPQTFYLLQKLG